MTTIWSSAYPASIDSYVPLVDHVDQVIANHSSTLAVAIVALETKIGITNGNFTGLGGLSFSPIGHATFPGALNDPTIWIDSSFTPEHLIFTDSTGADFDILNNNWTVTGTVLSPSVADNTVKVATSAISTAHSLEIDNDSVTYASIGLTGNNNLIAGSGHLVVGSVTSPTVGAAFSLLDTGYSTWLFGNSASANFGAVINPALSAVFTASGMIYDVKALHVATGNQGRVILYGDEGGGLGNRASIYATAETAVASSRPSYSKFASISYGSGNSTTEVISQISATGTTSLLNLHSLSLGAGTSEVNIYSQNGDINFSARASGNIPFNAAAPNNALVGFTATSIVGALNEVKSGVVGATLWSKVATTLSPLTANDKVSVICADASGISAITGTASGSGAYANIGGDFSSAGATGIGVKGYSTGATGYGVYGQTTQNTGYSGYFTGGKFTATGYGDIALTSSDGEISLNDKWLTSAINLSQTGTTGLVGYTATSIVAALNEVRASSPSAALLLDQTTPQTVINGRPTFAQGLTYGLTPTVGVHATGKTFWDATWKTLAVELEDDVTLQIGQENHIYCYNGTGAPITQGKAVYIVGVNAGIPSIALAKADALATSNVLGVVTSTSIADSTYGYVTAFGMVNNLDTSAWVAGDLLYLSSATDGLLTNVQPSAGNFDVKVARVMTVDGSTGRVFVNVRQLGRLIDLSDVTVNSPSVDEVLRYNGVEWVNGAPVTSSASAGIEFFPDTTDIIPLSAENSFRTETLNKYPVTTAENVDAISCVSNTVIGGAYLYNTALGRTTIDAGNWSFEFYLSVSSVAAGRVSYVTKNLYKVSPYTSPTVSITGGPGTSRTCTASSGTPFAVTKIDASATNTIASFVQTPKGVYQITARTSDTEVTISVPAAYVNETTVAFSVWKKLFGVNSPTITNIGTSYGLYSTNSAQSSFTVELTDKLGMFVFGTSNNTTTVNYVYNGSTRYSHFSTPLITLHNNLAGLQGGTATEYYHLTSAQHSGLTGGGSTALHSHAVPTTITVANEASDTTCFPLFVTAATGDLGPKTVSSFTFNSNTGALASTLFAADTITANLAFVPDTNDGAALGTTLLQFSDLFLASGAVINYSNGASTITHSANTLTIGGSGATTLALGTNNLTMTGSIASTGARVTKGWFADLESTAGIVLGLDAATNTAGYLKMFSAGANDYYTTFTAGTQTANATYTLPTAPPTVDGQSLTSTTAGVMSWSTVIRDLEEEMTVYKNIFNDFTAVYKDADEIELVGLPFNITAVQIRRITRKPTGSNVSVVKTRGVDLVCTWTVDGSIAGKGSITTTSLGTLASTDEYIVEVEGEPKGYAASTDAVKSYVVNDVMAINDGLIATVSSDDVTITKSLLVDGFNAISLNVTLGAVGDFVKVLGTNDPAGATGFYDITALACGVPLIVTSGAYQTSSVIMFPYIQIVVDGNTTSASAYLTRFLKK